MNSRFMFEAINEAYEGISRGDGGPFGAVVVKNNEIIGRGHNQVLRNNDPTCHGEIMAIRDACKNLDTFDLSDCELYTTGQCCTMCLCASMWSNIKHIYYGCTLEDNELIGFRDEKFNKIFNGRPENYETQICHDECLSLFADYVKQEARRY